MAEIFEGDRNDFLKLLENNNGLLIFKFTADWCSPCQKVKPYVDSHIESIKTPTIRVFEVNVDDCFDLFAFMKTKKMMKGIPTLMAYKKGNNNYPPDQSISGADIDEINTFFIQCRNL